jgi:hypothetical protein
MEVGGNTFVGLRADHLQVNNPGTVGVDLRTPSLPFLEEMRNAQLVNLSTSDLLEDTPSFERGTLQHAWAARSTTCSAAAGRPMPNTCTSTAKAARSTVVPRW